MSSTSSERSEAPIAIDRIEIAVASGLPTRYDHVCHVLGDVPAAQKLLDSMLPLAGKQVHQKVEVNIRWKDGERHRAYYRLGRDTCLRGKIMRYFMVYAGLVGGLTEQEKTTILPAGLRSRYQNLLRTHQLG